mmetsp:Transcript_24570/g.34327  ORF Transcript_24570/g.34327 Transcript_24570/m.34327 type:complete len:128 (+) Transcript_24570:103-486(+)
MVKLKRWSNPFKDICRETSSASTDMADTHDYKSLPDIPRLPLPRMMLRDRTNRTRKRRDDSGSLIEQLDNSLRILFGKDQPLLFHQSQLKGLFEETGESQTKRPEPSKMMEVDSGAEHDVDTKLHSS